MGKYFWNKMKNKIIKFPDNFRFGIADADLQVIGEKNISLHENTSTSMWKYYAVNSNKVFNNDTPDIGVDRYNKYSEDIQIMNNLGIKHYRTSVSILRTLDKNGEPNLKALEWYRNFFEQLKKSRIKIYVTLYHWELPQFLSEIGGWENKKTVNFYLKHVDLVVKLFKEYVEEFFLINEPRCIAFYGYYRGIHAPGETSLKKSLLVAHNLLLAQGLAFNKIKNIDKKIKVSTVLNLTGQYALTSNEKDLEASKISDEFNNKWFLDPIFKGKYPEELTKIFGKNMPHFTSKEMQIIKIGDKLDSFGINYYHADYVKFNSKKDLSFDVIKPKKILTNDLGWPISIPPHYNKGLYDLLVKIHSEYKIFGLKNIYISENGVAFNDKLNKTNKLINDKKGYISYNNISLKFMTQLLQECQLKHIFYGRF